MNETRPSTVHKRTLIFWAAVACQVFATAVFVGMLASGMQTHWSGWVMLVAAWGTVANAALRPNTPISNYLWYAIAALSVTSVILIVVGNP